jgi:hypothetical protein
MKQRELAHAIELLSYLRQQATDNTNNKTAKRLQVAINACHEALDNIKCPDCGGSMAVQVSDEEYVDCPCSKQPSKYCSK